MKNPFNIVVDTTVPDDTIIIRGEYEETRSINIGPSKNDEAESVLRPL